LIGKSYGAGERAHPVLDGYHDEFVSIGSDNGGHVLCTVANTVATAVNPDQNRKVIRIGWSPDVQEQTVFITRDERGVGYGWVALWTGGTEVVGLHNCTVDARETWRLPS